MDKIEQLYNLYLEQNIITDATSLEDFRAANSDQQGQLYDLGVKKNLFKNAKVEDFSAAWSETVVSKRPEQSYSSGYDQLAPMTPRNSDIVPDGYDDDLEQEEGADTITESVKYDETEGGELFKDDIVYSKNATPLERSLAYVNRDLFKRDEEPVENRLRYLFGDYDFKFKDSGWGDNITVTAPDGITEETFPVDAYFNSDNGEQARALRDFIRENQKKDIDEQEEYNIKAKKYFSRKAVDEDIAILGAEAKAIGKEVNAYHERRRLQEEAMHAFSDAGDGSYTSQEYQIQLQEKEYLDKEQERLQDQYEAFEDVAAELDLATGNYIRMKEEDGTLGGTITMGSFNKILGFYDSALSTVGGTGIEAYYKMAQGAAGNDFQYSKEEYQEEFIRVYEGYRKEDAPQSAKDSEEGFNEWIETLKGSGEDLSIYGVNEGREKLQNDGALGGIFSDSYIILEDDPRIKRLNPNIYDISKGIKIIKESGGIGIGQPVLNYGNPLVWSIQEEEWIEAPNMINQDTIYDQIDDMVGDQKIKRKKEAFKGISRDFFQDIIGFSNVSEERLEAQMNQEGAMGIIATGY